jgi:hypothetical protein
LLRPGRLLLAMLLALFWTGSPGLGLLTPPLATSGVLLLFPCRFLDKERPPAASCLSGLGVRLLLLPLLLVLEGMGSRPPLSGLLALLLTLLAASSSSDNSR